MSRVLLLDSGPLGLLTQPRISFEVGAINRLLIHQLRLGDRVPVPAIVYHEIRRELLRAEKSAGLLRLDAFTQADPHRYLQLSDAALRLAAELWARPGSKANEYCFGPGYRRDLGGASAYTPYCVGGRRGNYQSSLSQTLCKRSALE